MPIINASDSSNPTADSASTSTGTPISASDSGKSADVATQSATVAASSFSGLPYADKIPNILPGTFTNFGLDEQTLSGVSFELSNVSTLPSSLPFNLSSYWGGSPANQITGVGWEIKVMSGTGYTFMCNLPRYSSASFSKELNGEGAGQVVLDRSDAIFSTAMANGGSGTDLLDDENFWQMWYNGKLIFEFLGTTVDEIIVDASSEAQPVTISGAGTARTLKWAISASPGFPNIINKLAALTDTFSKGIVDAELWNLTQSSDIGSGMIYVDTNTSSAAVQGREGTLSSAPLLSSGHYDATNSQLSAKVCPIGQPVQPVNYAVNGSFVLGTQSWDVGASAVQAAGAVATSYTSDSQDGDGYCVQVTANHINQGLEQSVTGLAANTTYIINAWVKLQAQTGVSSPQINLRDTTNGINAPASSAVAVMGQWTQLTTKITTGATGNVTLLYSINNGSGSGTCTYLLDNVILYGGFPGTSTAIMLAQNGNETKNYVMMELDWGSRFVGRCFNNGVETDVTLANSFDPVYHQFWRVREFNGTFYFDASADGTTWSQYGSLAHTWSAKSVIASFTAWYDSEGYNSGIFNLPAEFGSVNSGVSTTVGLQNAYTEVPNVGGIFLDLLQQSQARGTCTFITPTFTATQDSEGVSWTDKASLVVSNGSDLETQLSSSVAAVDGDWIMLPNFQLEVGNPGSLGTDKSGSVIFYSSGHILSHERLRIRDQISNYVIGEDGSGNIVLQTDTASRNQWTQRETYVQSSTPTTKGTLSQMTNAALLEFKSELSQRTLTVPPELPGRTVFVDYDVADWIGVQNPDLQSVAKVRVIAAAVTIDGSQDLVSVELTLETRIQLFVEQMNFLLQKIGYQADAQVIPASGPVSQTVTASNQATSTSYYQTLGDGATKTFSIAHALGTQNVSVVVRQAAAPYALVPSSTGATQNYSVTFDSANSITVTFTTAPAANAYTVYIHK